MQYNINQDQKDLTVKEKLEDMNINISINGLEAVLLRGLLHKTSTAELKAKLRDSDFFESREGINNKLVSTDFLDFFKSSGYLIYDHMGYEEWNSLYKEILKKL